MKKVHDVYVLYFSVAARKTNEMLFSRWSNYNL